MTQTAPQPEPAEMLPALPPLPKPGRVVVKDALVFVSTARGAFNLTWMPSLLSETQAAVIFAAGRDVSPRRLRLKIRDTTEELLDAADLHNHVASYHPPHLSGSNPKRDLLAIARERVDALQRRLSDLGDFALELDEERHPEDYLS